MKKVLIITYYWPPSGGAGVQRWVKFSKYLPEFKVKPLVLTVDPVYASYPLKDETLVNEISENVQVFKTKSFEPFNIYKAFTKSNEIPYGGFANESKPGLFKKISRFIRGNFFIPDARVGWNTYALQKAVEIIESEKPDLIITTSPPHSSQLIGLSLKKKFNLPWIADLRDPWTEIYYYDKMLHTPIAKKKDLDYEKRVLENADAIIVVSEHIRDSFLKKSNRLDTSKFFVIPNGYDEDDFMEELKITSDTFCITYTGTVTDEYNLDGFISALKKLIDKFGNKVLFRFVGSLPDEVKNLFQLHIPDNFENIPHVSHSEAIQFMRRSSVLLLAIPNNRDNKGILTGKLFEYLASQRPIIGIGPLDGEAAGIVNYCKSGNFFEYEDAESIYKALENYYEKWVQNEDNYFVTNANYKDFSREKLSEKLFYIIENQVTGK